MPKWWVSIPFKRESLSKDADNAMVLVQNNGFNSLQTGKPIQSTSADLSKVPYMQFQFPSNGKAYPKSQLSGLLAKKWVSIPFKRESLSKELAIKACKYINPFQFPSNGKAYPKIIDLTITLTMAFVSIPFKRESLSKGISAVQRKNGGHVSIPFKRESLSKAKG